MRTLLLSVEAAMRGSRRIGCLRLIYRNLRKQLDLAAVIAQVGAHPPEHLHPSAPLDAAEVVDAARARGENGHGRTERSG